MLQQISSYHDSQRFAGQTVYWSGSDTFERWHNNMKDLHRKKQLEQHQFDKIDSISYSFNQHGFRCKEFNSDDGFIALGCSFTQGVGLRQNQIWPSIVEQHTRLVAWNLGVGACSTDTCFRLLYNWIEKLKPKFVMLLTPTVSRFEFFLDSYPTSFYPEGEEHNIKKYWYLQDGNSEVNAVKNYLAMKQLCQNYNTKFVTAPLDIMIKNAVGSAPLPPARDFLHAGHANHVTCANYFLNKLNQN